MPKLTLEFSMPEDTQEFNDAMNGPRFASASHEMYSFLRDMRKHRDDLNEDQLKVVHEITDKFNELFAEIT